MIISFTSTAYTRLQNPYTRKTDTADNYFGTKIADSYRCQVDDKREEAKAWVQGEKKRLMVSWRKYLSGRISDTAELQEKYRDNTLVYKNNSAEIQRRRKMDFD